MFPLCFAEQPPRAAATTSGVWRPGSSLSATAVVSRPAASAIGITSLTSRLGVSRLRSTLPLTNTMLSLATRRRVLLAHLRERLGEHRPVDLPLQVFQRDDRHRACPRSGRSW